MATTTKGNTKEASSKMKPHTEKGTSAQSATKTTASKAAPRKATTSKTTTSKATGIRKTAADTTAAARTAGKKASTGSNTATRDHDTIRAWVEKRGGVPSVVKGTAKKKDGDGILRIDFPGYSGEDSLQEISWEEFFRKFDESQLEFLYQEKTADGKESRFNKFVSSN
ncbi:MAG: hypothetical protein J7619_09365 [Dyadobacter sp.]|uniref:hypothetical protein n=1 Tax=Dyadobacter sp. TaxID=1914288 RepID=UPI001B0BF7A3|nr:hypothetical protein [Dyadobacter sp.]MBO9612891.1 hypothetical protein [Dyadobacter sp.]